MSKRNLTESYPAPNPPIPAVPEEQEVDGELEGVEDLHVRTMDKIKHSENNDDNVVFHNFGIDNVEDLNFYA